MSVFPFQRQEFKPLCKASFFVVIYLLGEKMRISRGRAEKRERIPNRLRAVCPEPNVGLEFMNHEIMT